jgi:tellurite resistance protein
MHCNSGTMVTMRIRPLRCLPWLAWLAALMPLVALARVGGGQHYSQANGQSGAGSHGGSGGGGDGGLILAIIQLTLRYPQIMCPLLALVGVGFFFYQRANNPTARTQRALQDREAEARTQVSESDVAGWLTALKAKDPQLDPPALYARFRKAFTEIQDAWFRRDLSQVRPFLSDAMFQRLTTQLRLLQAQGVRNAISDVAILDLQLAGLEQSAWFDTLRVKVRAQMRDVDVPADQGDEQARAAAAKAPLEPFTEIWSFVRKPGAVTRIGADVYQGKCPNCGAPFKGGAANTCEFCAAIVNSGNYDWTLSEIVQGVAFDPYVTQPEGLSDAQRADPALNVEMLQDRASLIFWKWIDAESRSEAQRLAKLATPGYLASLSTELDALKQRGQHKVFLECAVGSVTLRALRVPDQGAHEAHVEIRWSARMGVGPTLPQRWVFSLCRGAGAKTNAAAGMSTNRCPQCNAPLTDSLTATCDFCGFALGAGERDWVLAAAVPVERWHASEQRPSDAAPGRVAAPDEDSVLDAEERERLLYMMAGIAAADGVVTDSERRMLQLFSKRWSVPWDKVEMALNAGPALFERLIPREGTPEAELFLKSLVEMALVDGKVDRAERRMLDAAAQKLGLVPQLARMLGR